MKKTITLIFCLLLAAAGAQVSNVSVNSNTKVLVSPTAAQLAAANTLFVVTSGSYADPAWITSLAASKVTGLVTALTADTTTTSGFNAGDVLISDGTKLQPMTIGAGVANALGQTANAANGLMILDGSGLIPGKLNVGVMGTGILNVGAGDFIIVNGDALHIDKLTPGNGVSAALAIAPNAAGGFLSLDGSALAAPANLGSGSAITTKFLRGDGTWQTVSSGITIGGTTIASGTATRLLYEKSDNTVGEITGATSDGTTLTLVAPILGTPASGNFGSGTFTWPTFNQNTTGSAATLTTARTIGITGDGTWGSGSFNGSANVTSALTLATVNATTGTFGDATHYASFTVNGKGLVTASSQTAWPTFNQNTSGNAATVTTNANLTGPITSVGNATSVASQTGTGTKFVMDTSPSLNEVILTAQLVTTPPANGISIGAYTLGGLSFCNSSGFISTISSRFITGTHLYTLPDSAGTFTLNSFAQALTNKTYEGNTLSTGTGTLTLSTFTLTADTTGTVVVQGGALGTPSSGTVTNLTGTGGFNTTGSAATLTTPRNLYGFSFNGSAATVSGTDIIASGFGGTGNGFTKFSGPTTAERTKTLRDVNDTILELGGSYTPTGTFTNMVLVTPALGTPSALVGTNLSGTGASFTAGNATLAAGLSATLVVAQGGTGRATLTLNNVLLGNGTTAVQMIAPGTSGNVLTSDGTTWASTAPAAAAAGSLTGTTLASNVVTSSLTSVGVLSAGTVPTTLLTGTITNAQLAGSIAYTKLILTGNVTNGDLAGSIATSKLASATTVGGNILALTNPGAISFPKIAADNTVSTRTPAQVLSDIGGDNASNLASGTLADARLPAAVANITSLTGAALAITPSSTGTIDRVNLGATTPGTGVFTTEVVNTSLGIGTVATAVSGQFEVSKDSAETDVFFSTFSTAQNAPTIVFQRARGTRASKTAVANNDIVGTYQANAYQGAGFNAVGVIQFEVDGTVNSGQRPPGRMIFQTAISNGALTTALTINSSQAAAFAGAVSVTGATTLTGNLTSNGALITVPEALAPALNAGAAVGVTTLTSTIAVNGVNAVTLANGTNGQVKTVVCTAVTAAGTATVTPTTANGFTTFAFTTAGQSVTLQYFSTGGWSIISVRGATIAAVERGDGGMFAAALTEQFAFAA